MVDDKPEGTGPAADGGSDTSRRTRTPPTLDLEASRVETSDPVHLNQAHLNQADVDPAHGDTAHAGPVDAESLSAADAAAAQSSADKSAADKSPEPQARKGAGVLVSALAGAVAALLIGCGAWFAGLLGGSNGQQGSIIATLETMAARVARLEAAPSPPPTLKADPALTARLDAMDKSLAMLRAHYDRLTKSIEEIKAAPRGTAATAAATPDLSAVESRLAQLDAKTQALSAESAQVKESVKETVKEAQAKTDARIDGTLASIKAVEAKPAPPADDIKLRRIIAANSLDLAVRQGDPFAAALGTAKQLADNAADLKPLEGFAAGGVPSAAALSRDLLALLPQLETKPEGAPAGSGWFDRLQASAAQLIKYRRSGEVAGDDNATILSRVAAAAGRNDVTEAKREVSALPPPARAKAQPWIDKVAARDAALAASRQFAANAMAALTTSPR